MLFRSVGQQLQKMLETLGVEFEVGRELPEDRPQLFFELKHKEEENGDMAKSVDATDLIVLSRPQSAAGRHSNSSPGSQALE